MIETEISQEIRDQNGREPTDIHLTFKILWKCKSKFDCLISEILFIKHLKPSLNKHLRKVIFLVYFIVLF